MKLPCLVVQRAGLPRLEPARNAMKMEGVIAHTPCHRAGLRGGAALIGLTLDAQVHDVIAANGAIVHDQVP